jgi:hypothetical protein
MEGICERSVAHRRQPIELPLSPAIHDGHVLAVDMPGVLEALAKSAQTVDDIRVRRSRAEEPDNRHRGLLRDRRAWPLHGRAAEQCDELAPFQLIEVRRCHSEGPQHTRGR